MAKLLLGKEVTAAMNEKLQARVAALKEKGVSPKLAIVRCGENPSDLSYEKGATARAELIGVEVVKFVLPEDVTKEALIAQIEAINADDSIHGCLMFRPLPKHLKADQDEICNHLAAAKDVDCMTDLSNSGVFTGKKLGFAPCTPQACMEILDYYGIDCKGKNAVVIGRSLVVGKPAAMMLMAKNATVTVCHTKTVVGAGVEYLLGCLAHLFAGSTAAVENPGYSRTRAVLENNGIPCVPVEIDESGLPIRALEQSGANLCYVTPSHHFPTGVTMPAPRRAQLLAWAAAKPGRFILEDDYDSEFRFATRPLPSLQGMSGANGPVVYLTTFSKSLAPGMRIACMVLPQGLLERYQSDFSMYANTVSRYEQQTLCEFMANGYFARHIARMRLTYKRRMEAFAAALHAGLDPDLTLAGAHSGLHFLLTLPGAGGEQAMVQAAAKQGVRLKGLSEYYMQDAAHCRPDTVVAGYSGLQAEDIPAAAAALGRAWRQMSHSII